MVVVDKLTKDTHFIPVKTTDHKETSIAYIYMKEVVRLQEISKALLSDRNTKFNSNIWKGLFKGFGTNLNMSTTYHTQMGSHTERVNHVMFIHPSGRIICTW